MFDINNSKYDEMDWSKIDVRCSYFSRKCV